MPLPKPCLDCGTVTPASRCPACMSALNARLDAARIGKRDHYAGDYYERAAAIRNSAHTCWICGQPARLDDPWQADHVVAADPASELRAAHRSCNIARSNKARAERR